MAVVGAHVRLSPCEEKRLYRRACLQQSLELIAASFFPYLNWYVRICTLLSVLFFLILVSPFLILEMIQCKAYQYYLKSRKSRMTKGPKRKSI